MLDRRASVKETRELYAENERLRSENKRLLVRIEELTDEIRIRDERSDRQEEREATLIDLLKKLLAHFDFDKEKH